ncbi:hypothetical protein JCM6882_006620 [Rhodosporidiobolus microsporus]
MYPSSPSLSPPPSPTAVPRFQQLKQPFPPQHRAQPFNTARPVDKPTFVDPFKPKKNASPFSPRERPAPHPLQWRERGFFYHAPSPEIVVFDGGAVPDSLQQDWQRPSSSPHRPATPAFPTTIASTPSTTPPPPLPILPPSYTSSLAAPPVPPRSLRRRPGRPTLVIDPLPPVALPTASAPASLTPGGASTPSLSFGSGSSAEGTSRMPLECPTPVRAFQEEQPLYLRYSPSATPSFTATTPPSFEHDDLSSVVGYFPAPPSRPALKLRLPPPHLSKPYEHLEISPLDSPASGSGSGFAPSPSSGSSGAQSGVPTPAEEKDEPPATIGLGLRIQLDDLRLSSTFAPEYATADEGDASRTASTYLSQDTTTGSTCTQGEAQYASSVEVGEREGYDPFDLRRFLRRLSSAHEYPTIVGVGGGEKDDEHERKSAVVLVEASSSGETLPSATEVTTLDLDDEEEEGHAPLWRLDQSDADTEEGAEQLELEGVTDWSGCRVDGFVLPPDIAHLILAHTLSTPSDLNNLLFGSLGLLRETLVVLDISSCGLTALPYSLTSLRSLRELDVSSNVFSHPFALAPLSALTSLRVLLADACDLSALPSSLAQLEDLHTLALRENRLRALPSWLCRLRRLEVLLVEDNPFHRQVENLVKPLRLSGAARQEKKDDREILVHDEAAAPPFSPTSPSGFFHRHLAHSPLEHVEEPPHSPYRHSFLLDYARPAPVPLVDELPPSYPAALRSLLAYLRDLDDLTPPLSTGAGESVSPPATLPLIDLPRRETTSTLRTSQSLGSISTAGTSTPPPPLPPSPGSLRYTQSTRALRPSPSFTSTAASSSSAFRSPPTSPTAVPLPLSPTVPPAFAAAGTSSDMPKRLSLLREIVETESTYLRGLEELCVIYVSSSSPSALNPSTVLPAQEWRAVFGNVEAIRDFHRGVFLPELVAAAALEGVEVERGTGSVEGASRRAAGRVAEVFEKRAAFLRVYSSYINNCDSALSRISSWAHPSSRSSFSSSAHSSYSTPTRPATTGSIISSPRPLAAPPSALELVLASPSPAAGGGGAGRGEAPLSLQQRKRIRSWLKRCRSHPSHTQISLASYLLLPVQRIPRYRLLLEGLLASTPASAFSGVSGYPFPPVPSPSSLQPDTSHTQLACAAQALQDLNRFLNESKRDAEGREGLVRWQGRVVQYVEEEKDGKSVRRRKWVRVVEPWRGVVKVGEVVLSRSVKRVPLQPAASFAAEPEADEQEEEKLFSLEHETKKVQLVALLCTDVLLLLRPPPAVSSSAHPLGTSTGNAGLFELYKTIKLDALGAAGAGAPASLFGEDGVLRLLTPTQIFYLRFPSPSSTPSSPALSRSPSSPSLSPSLHSPLRSGGERTDPALLLSPRDEGLKQARAWEAAVNGQWRKERGG